MGPDVYERLRSRLDTFPTSFPKTHERIEITMLKKLFSEEEAEIASTLPMYKADQPCGPRTIADRINKEINEVEKLLEAMARKGLIYVSGHKESKRYALLPFMPGILEFNVDRIDPELSKLSDKYFFKDLGPKMAKSKLNMNKFVPVNQSLPAQTTVHPHAEVAEAINKSSSICVMPCVCRTKKKVLGKDCGRPMDVCLYLNEYADYLNEVGKGRKITREEALAVLKEAQDAGLVHQSTNAQKPIVICNCCGCCCLELRGTIKMINAKMPGVMESNFRLVIDEKACNGCDTCIDRCWTQSLNMEGEHVVVDYERCIGCGQCAYICPTEALRLEQKPPEEIKQKLHDFAELVSEMGWRKGKEDFL